MNRFDDCNRGGSVPLAGAIPSDGLSAWVDPNGVFATGVDGASGETVVFEANPGANQVAWLNCAAVDHLCEIEIVRIDSQAAPAVRVVDPDNMYFFMATSGGATSLWKKVAGEFFQLAVGSINFTPGVGKTLGCSAVGDVIKGYVDGVEAASAIDEDLGASTNAGIRTSDAFHFINSIAITDLSSGGGSFIDNTAPILNCLLGVF